MTVGLATGSIEAAPGQLISLSSLFTVTPGAGDPQFLIVGGLDRNEYTTSSTNSTGTLNGNGHTLGFSSIGGDGIIFTHNASTGQYVNASYGNLSGGVLTASHDQNRNESISLFAAKSSAQLTQYANNPYALEPVEVVAANSAGLTAAETVDTAMAPTAAKFAQAMSAVHNGWGAAGTISASSVDTNTIPRLASPIA